MPVPDITILLSEQDRPYHPGQGTYTFLIWYIVDAWRRMGLDVDVVRGIPPSSQRLGLVVPHIDLTKIPPRYAHFLEQCPKALNRRMIDISKRRISTNLVTDGAGFEGPVIVKTDANYGGMPERLREPRWQRWGDKARRLAGPGWRRHMFPGEYPVYDSAKDVPRSVWRNPNLVVERYIPERDGAYYCIRICFFLGDVVLNHRLYSKAKVIKGAAVEHSEPADVPDAIHAKRAEMGFDYGKFDYVIHDGAVHILDANKTPGVLGKQEVNVQIAEKLAKGIQMYRVQ